MVVGREAAAGGTAAWGRQLTGWAAVRALAGARCNESTLHFVRPRSREWMFLWRSLLDHTGDRDEEMLNAGETWQYQGTWFHPSARRWVHELRHRWHPAIRERVSVRLPASAGYQPPAMAAERAELPVSRGRPPEIQAPEGWAEYVLFRPGAERACFQLGRGGRGDRPVWDRLLARARRGRSPSGRG
jgi:hypothetical protein